MCNATMQEARVPALAEPRAGPAPRPPPVTGADGRLSPRPFGWCPWGRSPGGRRIPGGGGTLMIRKPRTAMRRTGLQDQGKGDRVAEARFGIRPAMIL